jgi:inhibitor of KinA
MNSFPISSIKNLGPFRLLLKWDCEISRPLLNHILKLQKVLNQLKLPHLAYSIKSYNELALVFKQPSNLPEGFFTDINDEVSLIDERLPSKTHVIKVKYHHESADMDQIIQHTKLNREKIIELHTKPLYDVHFVGFLPGFMYLGGMDKRINMPRKTSPNQVRKGSVAIAGMQTGIYPQSSPGGWTIIGTTSHSFFNADVNPPMKIIPGDYIKFEAQDKRDD